MKIEKPRLNPLYHQYSNPENRLTHALLHTVTSSRWIFARFIKQIAEYKGSINGKNFEATTQKVPFEQADNDPGKIESIPDNGHLHIEITPRGDDPTWSDENQIFEGDEYKINWKMNDDIESILSSENHQIFYHLRETTTSGGNDVSVCQI